MRTAFMDALVAAADADERIWLLTGDLGFSVVEAFADRFPGRFVNVGVAEQNMTGIAAGLALAGKTVFTYSIANFPVMRCLEQIRNDICYHNLNVKIVSVGGGYSYGSLGYSHHGLEDLAVTRVLPNMSVVAPGDPLEARLTVQAIGERPGPCYVRLGKAGEKAVHIDEPQFGYGKAIVLRHGRDVTLISTGAVLSLVVEAGERLRQSGVNVGVVSMPWLSPLDAATLCECAASSGGIVSVEEHGPGGLGSAISESLSDAGIQVPLRIVRLPREAVHVAGTQAYLRAMQGLTVENIVARAFEVAECRTRSHAA